jgi:hypothetical protein
VHPALWAATARLSSPELDEFARFKPPFGVRLDDENTWLALRAAVLQPEAGDRPHSDLQAVLEGWPAHDAKRLVVHLWRRGEDDPAHRDLWTGLSAEVAAARGVEGPEL